MMRVLHVITGLDLGGAESALAKVAGCLGGQGVHSSVVSLSRPGEMGRRLADTGVPVRDVGITRGRVSIPGLRRLRAVVRQADPDVLHGWMYHGNLAATLAVAARRSPPPLIWSIRQSLYALRDEPLLTRAVIRGGALLSSHADTIVYNSELSRRHHAAAGYSEARTLVIPNGFDLQSFRRDPIAREALRIRMSWDAATTVVCCVARYHPVKNHSGLLAAFGAVRASAPAARLLLIGSGMDESNGELARLVSRHDLRGSIDLVGETKEVAAWLSAADLFCLPSVAEGFPNVVGEAMACELPCVVTDVGDNSRLLGGTGWLAPRGDASALRRALAEAVSATPAERASRGRLARQRIEGCFSLPSVAQSYLELYAGATERARDRRMK
jgi:glycosyltransferase involved in cell wall biosynthesis